MAAFEEQIAKAIAERDLPHAVMKAVNKTGTLNYSKCLGPRSLKTGDAQTPITDKSMMWTASCTKLLTSIAALQCVEKELIKLDDSVYPILPELQDLEILTSFDADNKPIFKPNPTPITLRHLLTHTSGLAYEFLDPSLQAWRASRNESFPSAAPTVTERFLYPLVFEPGTSWAYGSSLDWAGKLVERLHGGISLEDYFHQHIAAPLGMTDITFQPPADRVPMTVRDPATGKVRHTGDADLGFVGAEEPMGGQGLFAHAQDYLQLVAALLQDDCGGLLRPSTARAMFRPQLGAGARQALADVLAVEGYRAAFGAPPRGAAMDWGLAGILFTEDFPGYYGAGTLLWGGYPNLTWWADRKKGLAGVWFEQLVPPGDPTSNRYIELFQKGVYAMAAEADAEVENRDAKL